MGRRSIDHKDPIHSRGIIYDVELIMFVDTYSDEELLKLKEEKKALKAKKKEEKQTKKAKK